MYLPLMLEDCIGGGVGVYLPLMLEDCIGGGVGCTYR